MGQFKLALLFTGHMVDLPGREVPRFPPRLEKLAADAIAAEVLLARKSARGSIVGIASGARGGDILFFEACRAAGIPIRMVLPFSVKEFLASSVRGVRTGRWTRRFYALWKSIPVHEREILHCPPGENPFAYCNRRMLVLAQELAARTRLIALWDGEGVDAKPGGTASFVNEVVGAGGALEHIDAKALLRGRRSQLGGRVL